MAEQPNPDGSGQEQPDLYGPVFGQPQGTGLPQGSPPPPPAAGSSGPVPPPSSPPVYYDQQQIQPQAQAPLAVPSTSSNAIAAFALAIVSWFACGPFFSIPALILAHMARREIRRSNGWKTGNGYVTTAQILAWLNIAAFVIVITALIVFAVFARDHGGFTIDPTFTPTPEPSATLF